MPLGQKLILIFTIAFFVTAFCYVIHCGRSIRYATEKAARDHMYGHHTDSLWMLLVVTGIFFATVMMLRGQSPAFTSTGGVIKVSLVGVEISYYGLFLTHMASNALLVLVVISALIYNGTRAPLVHRWLTTPVCIFFATSTLTGLELALQL